MSASHEQIEITLAPDLGAPERARRSLEDVEEKLRPDVFDDVQLLVNELVTNSVKHSGLEEGARIELRVAIQRNLVRVQVTDQGDGFEPRDRDAPLTHASGWGLYLVDKLAHRWGVEGKGRTCVWFEIEVPAG